MSDKAKLTIENSFNRIAEQQSKDTLRPFLEEGETFYSALQKLVKDSFKRPGLNIKEPTIGKVLKVVKNGQPIPGGPRYDLNGQNNFVINNCLQVYVHTMFDAFLSMPSDLITPGKEETLIYQHYIYEAESLELDNVIPNVGDNVYVVHPLAKGYLNRVGTYMGIVGKTAVPITNDSPIESFSEHISRKGAVPFNLPEQGECAQNPFGDECAWSRGRVIGKIDLQELNGPRGGFRARSDVASQYNLMKRAFEKDNPGETLKVNSGFRSYKQQFLAKQRWTKKGKPENAADPGFSKHQNGIAVDIETGTDDPRRRPTKVYTWLKNNAADFGFIRTVQNEPWHWVYYGVTYAKKNVPSWQ
jgi:hypothetical protein